MNANRIPTIGFSLAVTFVAGCNDRPGPPPSATGGHTAPQSLVTRVGVDHVRVTSDKPYREVTEAFAARLGKYDACVASDAIADKDPAAGRAKLERMAGPSGFMLFGTQDHGALLHVVGRKWNAVQYVVGNPLFAVEMTQHAIGASLYAPLRVLIYETDDGKTCVEYDRPSTLFGQFGDHRVDAMAKTLDDKLKDAISVSVR